MVNPWISAIFVSTRSKLHQIIYRNYYAWSIGWS